MRTKRKKSSRCRNIWHLLLWKLGGYKDSHANKTFPKNFSYPLDIKPLHPKNPSVVWINHSTFLLQIEDICILTDPIWSSTCSPIPFIGPKRRHPYPLSLVV